MLKLLLFILLLYLVLRTASNLLQAVKEDARGYFGDSQPPPPRNSRASAPPHRSPPQKQRATRYEPQPDIEDAKWEDL